MGKRMKLITKASIDEEKNLELINKKILELKEQFSRHTYNHIENLYKILSEIVKLKQYFNKNYTQRSLEWEKDLELTSMQIRYIFSYKYISSYAKEKVKAKLITDVSICHFLAVSALLRESRWQNRLIDKIINEEMKVSEVSELTQEELKLYLLGKLKIRKDDKYLLTATKSLRSIFTRIEERKRLMKKSPYSKNLVNAIRKLNELVNNE